MLSRGSGCGAAACRALAITALLLAALVDLPLCGGLLGESIKCKVQGSSDCYECMCFGKRSYYDMDYWNNTTTLIIAIAGPGVAAAIPNIILASTAIRSLGKLQTLVQAGSHNLAPDP